MAGIGREGKRRELKRIVFRDAAGKQQSLRLGKCSEKAAQAALAGFERVFEAHRLGTTIHPDGVRWLESVDDRIHARIAAFGFVEPRKSREATTLATLVSRFQESAVVKASTRAAYKQAIDSLLEHFAGATQLQAIGPQGADRWRRTIAGSGLAPATVAKRVHVAKAIFRKAVKWGMIPMSPFADLRAGSQANPDRAYYVAADTIQKVLAACSDRQWRAIIALSRFAGLRCPSEIVELRWGDVNWERGRLTVRSPKTAGHEGHAVRLVPIAPELRPILQDLFDEAEPGIEWVVPRLRDSRLNLRTQFHKIIERAGEAPWPRLFHNLRASCATDWVERFPGHVVAGWLGHSPLIAAKHYLQVRDSHFDAAAGVDTAAASAAAQAPPSDTSGSQRRADANAKRRDLVPVGAVCNPMESGEWALLGSNQ